MLASFHQHIILNVLGYVLLLPQAIMILSERNNWARHLSLDHRNIIQIVLLTCGTALILAGSIIRILNSSSPFRQSFNTGHGVMGLISLILACLNLICGICHHFTGRDKRMVKIANTSFSYLTIIFGFITLCIGFTYDPFRILFGDANVAILIIVTIYCAFDLLLNFSMNDIK